MRRRRFNFDSKKLYVILGVVFVFVVSITIVYAALSTTLKFIGRAEVSAANWNVYLSSPLVTSGSVSNVVPTITGNTTASFSANLTKPGDFYEFTIRVVNDGTIDAMISEIVKMPELTSEQAKYLKYEITYDSGLSISSKQYVAKKSYVILKVRVEYRSDILVSDLPTSSTTLNLSFKVVYAQGTIRDSLGSDSGLQSNNSAVVVAMGRTLNVPAGVSLYDGISSQLPTGSNIRVGPTYVTDLDFSQYFFDDDGRVMNLNNTIVEAGEFYESIYLFPTENSYNINLDTVPYKTVFVDVTELYDENGFSTIPVITVDGDTYFNICHAIFPSAYIYSSVKTIAALEQEVIEEYVLGYPSGQDAGCAGTLTEHIFYALRDEAGIPIKLDTATSHLDVAKAYIYKVSENDATYEEAKYMALEYFMNLVGWS